jgi:3',5'-cyclic AMP phosphodiesterase CpdA
MVKRAIIYRFFIILLIPWFAIILPANALSSAEPDTLTFIHVTDIHACNLTGYHPFFAQKRLHFGSNISTFPVFLDSVSDRHHSDFVVVTGDNIDFFEAETEKGWMLDTQVEQYSRLLEHSKIPVYLTLGNHDIASYWINPATSVSWSQINAEKARAAWMRNVACFKEGTYYSRLYKIDTVTFRLIFLDNSYYSTEEISDGVLPFTVDQFQLRWLDAQMKASPSDVEIIFMHIPLPYSTPTGSKTLSEPISVYSSKTKVYNLITVLEKNSSTRLIFAGHKHINLMNNYIFPDGNNLTQIQTAAFGYGTSNWRIIKLTDDKIIVSYPGSCKTELILSVR